MRSSRESRDFDDFAILCSDGSYRAHANFMWDTGMDRGDVSDWLRRCGFPYADTFCQFGEDGGLYTGYCPVGILGELNSTGGGLEDFEDREMVIDIYGNEIPLDEAVQLNNGDFIYENSADYVEWNSSYYHIDDTVYSEIYDERIPEDLAEHVYDIDDHVLEEDTFFDPIIQETCFIENKVYSPLHDCVITDHLADEDAFGNYYHSDECNEEEYLDLNQSGESDELPEYDGFVVIEEGGARIPADEVCLYNGEFMLVADVTSVIPHEEAA